MINAQMRKSLFTRIKRPIVRFLSGCFTAVLDRFGMNLLQQSRTTHMWSLF